jgi:hypothetical protein
MDAEKVPFSAENSLYGTKSRLSFRIRRLLVKATKDDIRDEISYHSPKGGRNGTGQEPILKRQ